MHRLDRSFRKLLRLAVLLLGCSATSSCLAQKAKIHTAEEPLPPIDAAASMVVPEGVRVTLFAGEPDVMQPIGFCIDDRSRLWVVEAYSYPVHSTEGRDRIVILEDVDGDGRHDKRTVFYDRLNYVSGIEVGFGGVWVMSPPSMFFIPDANGDDVPDGPPTVVLDGFGTHANAHNIANGFAWGPDGWLYATHGRTNWSMIGRPGDTESQRKRFDGGVWRYHPTRDVWEAYADGTTNPWGIDWNDWGDAFTTNCVNPHLFQVIPGAHYEPWRGRASSRYAYQRIDTIADHLHFVGLSNVRNGLGSDAEDTAGGGHAHCGTMIYLADHFPPDYRNQLFTNNIHGRRINNDLLRQDGSGYVATHGPDLMKSRDPWFMGVTIATGPSGEIFVSDWSDTGECHSTRNTRRHTGRIYRLSYLKSDLPPADLRSLSDLELTALQFDDNDWKVRHARRRLQERASSGASMESVHRILVDALQSGQETRKRLRALWALHVTGGLSPTKTLELLHDQDENLRAWAVTLDAEDRQLSEQSLKRISDMALKGDSPRVRLAIASATQRLDSETAFPLITALTSRAEDAHDANLPLMIWYGMEPLLEGMQNDNLNRFVGLTVNSTIPRVAENGARRIIDSSTHRQQGLQQLTSHLPRAVHPDAIIRGILLGLEGQRGVAAPPAWQETYTLLQEIDRPEINRSSIELAMRFRDPAATRMLRDQMLDSRVSIDKRKAALEALAKNSVEGLPKDLFALLDDAALRDSALKALARYSASSTDREILSRYSTFSTQEKQSALQTLASRRVWARSLIDTLVRGEIAAGDITAFTARQLDSLEDRDISRALSEVWGEVRETPSDLVRQMSTLRRTLTSDNLAKADHARGKALFQQHCGKCHRFFGEGGNIGPDLTGAQRTNLTYLLENILDPSASVAKEYRMHVVQTSDGRVISGLVENETSELVTIVNGVDRSVVPLDEIESRKSSEVSVMPTGLLSPLTEAEIRDLFGYLQK